MHKLKNNKFMFILSANCWIAKQVLFDFINSLSEKLTLNRILLKCNNFSISDIDKINSIIQNQLIEINHPSNLTRSQINWMNNS